MTISYIKEWNPDTGTCYRQRITLTQTDLKTAGMQFNLPPDYKAKNSKGIYNVYYGNADTGTCIAHDFYNIPGYGKQIKRIIPANSVIYVKLN